MDGNLVPRRAGFTPEKITRQHQERLAIIYIRQSTPQQVERNQESTKLQYALVDRVIADVDGVYDPANYNDRLLLGLKGTMSEAELHILKARMLAGRNAKARRGELNKPLPMGYLRRPSGEVAFDPDGQAQGVIRLVFE